MDDRQLEGVSAGTSVDSGADPPRSEDISEPDETPRLQRVPEERKGLRGLRRTKGSRRKQLRDSGKGSDEDDTDAGRPRTRRRRLRVRFRLPVVSLSVVAVLLLAASGYLAYQIHNDSVTDSQRSAALFAARQEAIALTTLSAKTGAADFNTVLAGSAGDLKQQLAAGKSDFIKTLSGASVTSSGTVLDEGVVSLKQSTSATVLLDVRASVSNKQTGKPETRTYHWKASMVYSNGRWLVTALEYV